MEFNTRQQQIIKEFYTMGLSATKISHLFNCGRHRIVNEIKILGVEVNTCNRINFSDRQIEIINEFAIRGMSLSKLSKLFNVTRGVIKRHIVSDKYICVLNNQKYKYKIDAFEMIDTEEKAYWLGFLYADGYISKNGQTLEIGLAEKDIGHLIKFSNFISEGDLYIQNKTNKINGKSYKSVRISIHNKKIVSDLIDKGCVNNKSSILTFPTFIKEDLIRHFIRGYIDGDGSLYVTKGIFSVNVLGTYKFIETLNNVFTKYIPSYTKISIYNKQKSNIYFLLKHNSQAKDIATWLYKNSSIYLDRKYQKYKENCI